MEKPLTIGESGDAFLRATRFSRIDTDVAYYDPSGPPPQMETRQKPEEPDEPSRLIGGNISMPVALITAAILLALAYVFARFGGNVTVSLGREAGNARRTRAAKKTAGFPGAIRPGSLNEILRIQNRRKALILLAQNALTTAVAANGVLLQRSWTAREALGHIPQDQRHINALRNLVQASERVHFGGRLVSEDEFLTHVDEIRPLLSGGPA